MIRYINSPGSRYHGCKVEPVPEKEGGNRGLGMIRVKLLEPTSSPGTRMGDVVTIHRTELSAKKI